MPPGDDGQRVQPGKISRIEIHKAEVGEDLGQKLGTVWAKFPKKKSSVRVDFQFSRFTLKDPNGIRWTWLAELQRRVVDIVRHLAASGQLLPR